MKLPRQLQRILRIAGLIALSLLLLASYLWAIGALWYDGLGKTFAIIQAVALPIALYLLKPRRKKIILFSAWFAVILIAWLCLRPSNQGDWQPDVAQLAHAEIDGDIVTLHNVRDCDYRSVTDYDTHWKTRTVRLSQITGIDLFVCTWGSPYMAHPIASFQFADAPPFASP